MEMVRVVKEKKVNRYRRRSYTVGAFYLIVVFIFFIVSGGLMEGLPSFEDNLFEYSMVFIFIIIGGVYFFAAYNGKSNKVIRFAMYFLIPSFVILAMYFFLEINLEFEIFGIKAKYFYLIYNSIPFILALIGFFKIVSEKR